MKLIKSLFPSGKKTAGTILMVVAGLVVYGVLNRKYGIEGKIASSLPDAGASIRRAS